MIDWRLAFWIAVTFLTTGTIVSYTERATIAKYGVFEVSGVIYKITEVPK